MEVRAEAGGGCWRKQLARSAQSARNRRMPAVAIPTSVTTPVRNLHHKSNSLRFRFAKRQ
ncbi:hypothetical protein IG631_19849 [Alternaria alternata]|nr:hypothetical protein IG631_19849 [Alternaria alternata]